jgi:hypothetical protein
MGKASRLKRLRRFQALSQQALADRVQRSMPGQPIKIIRNPPEMERISEVLADFASPWLDCVSTDEDYRRILQFAIIAWNSAHLPEKERFADLDSELLQAIGEPGLNLLRSMIDHKLAHYSDYNRPILDYQISGSGEDLRIDVVSSVPHPERFLGSSQLE